MVASATYRNSPPPAPAPNGVRSSCKSNGPKACDATLTAQRETEVLLRRRAVKYPLRHPPRGVLPAAVPPVRSESESAAEAGDAACGGNAKPTRPCFQSAARRASSMRLRVCCRRGSPFPYPHRPVEEDGPAGLGSVAGESRAEDGHGRRGAVDGQAAAPLRRNKANAIVHCSGGLPRMRSCSVGWLFAHRGVVALEGGGVHGERHRRDGAAVLRRECERSAFSESSDPVSLRQPY